MADATTREPGAGTEVALIAVGAAVLGAGFVVFLGARLAVAVGGDGEVAGGIGDWLRGGDPPAAWPVTERGVGQPGDRAARPVAVLGVHRRGRRGGRSRWRRCWCCCGAGCDPAAGSRRRFGQRTEAREATHRDVAPLTIRSLDAPTGRMLLGRMMPRGPLLATEDRDRHRLNGRHARRQGNRGSVALIGPTGSGKTALAASAIATWDGPVVAVSVKRDLYDTTATARASPR